MNVIDHEIRGRGNRGATAELIASVDLLRRGFDVFRAISPSCPCDLVAMRGSLCLRVEVRSGHMNPATGVLSIPMRETDRFDLLAVVVGDTIGYLGHEFTAEDFPFRTTDALRARILAKVYPEAMSEGGQ